MRARRILAVFGALAALATASTAWAAECANDDAHTWSRAVATLEPSLTASRATGMSSDAVVVARFLADANVSADGRTPAVAALAALARAYGLSTPDPDAAGPAAADAVAWTASAADALHTQAILITDDDHRSTITHAAVFWNSPLAQRLRIVRIPEALRKADNRASILDLLGTCAVEVEEWASAPQGLALAFLAEHVRASMLIVGREAESGQKIEAWIGPDEVPAALRFEHPRTVGLDEFSAWFTGEGPAPLALTRLIPTIRSSLGPGDLLELLRSLR